MLGRHTERTLARMDASKRANQRMVVLDGIENLYRKSKTISVNSVQTEEQKNIEELNLKMKKEIEKINDPSLKETKQVACILLELISSMPSHTLTIEKENGYDKICLDKSGDGSFSYRRVQKMEAYGSNSQRSNKTLTGTELVDFIEDNLEELCNKFENRRPRRRIDMDEI